MRHIVSLTACVTAVLLTACGGGGGGGSDDPGIKPDSAWAKSAGGPAVPSTSSGVAALTDGSAVVVGTFEGQATFGLGTPAATTLTSTGANDAFLARYDAAGNFVWARAVSGSDVTYVAGVAALPDGGFAVCGLFDVDVTFAPGEANETTFPTAGAHDCFVAKYSGDGQLLWVRHLGGGSYDQALAVAGLPDGSIAISGATASSPLTFGAGEANETSLVNSTLEGFVARYAGNGSLLWARGTESASYALFDGVAGTLDGSVAVVGQYGGDTTFGAGEPNETTLTSVDGTSDDVCIARYDANGLLVWARTIGGPAYDSAYGVAMGTDGSVAATGSFYESLTAGSEGPAPDTLESSGLESMYVVKYGAAGDFEWARQAAPVFPDFCASVGIAVRMFADGGVGVAGSLRGHVVFGAGEVAETTFLTADNDDRDGYVARYQPGGSLDWVMHVQDTGVGEATCLSPLADGSFLFCGYYEGQAALGVGDPNETLFTAVGTRDMYVGRANANGHL